MATVQDAIELLTDPRLTAVGPARGGHVEMRADEVLNELQERGAPSRAAAHALVLEALRDLGGQQRTEFNRRGGSGQLAHRFYVPESALRSPPVAEACVRACIGGGG
jgi:hypothetical protein